MRDDQKSKRELIDELERLREQVDRLQEHPKEDAVDGMQQALAVATELDIYRTAPYAVLVTRLRDGLIVEVSDTWCTEKGYARDELIGNQVSKLALWADIREREVLIGQLRSQGYCHDFPIRYRHRNGGIHHGHLTASLISYKNEPHIIGSVRDTTEAKKSEAQFRALFEESLDGLLVVSSVSGTILTYNAAVGRLLGYTPDQLQDQPFSLLFPTSSESINVVSQINTFGSVFASQPFLRADGSVCPMDVTATLIPWGDENAALVTLRDTTERHEAALALEASESRFQHLITSIRDHVYVTEVLPDHQRINRYISPNVERLTGYPASKLEERWDFWPTVIIHPDDQYLAAAQMLRFLDGDESSTEYRIVRANDDVLWVRDSARVVREGSSLMIYGTVSDITEQRLMHIQLHQSQKMEAIGQLAGGVAHDFNNLLVVISGYSELLLGRMLTPDTMPYRFVTEIQKAGQRATALVKQLLVISRRQITQPQTVDLNEIIRGMESILNRLVGPNMTLVMSLASMPTFIKVDPTQLEQVVLNLVVNARDAMENGGTIYLDSKVVAVTEANQRQFLGLDVGSYVQFQVRDTGVGMDQETQTRIFDPFFTTKEHGTGLGLATVHGIIKQNQGHIKVDSTPQRGTAFTIHLPNIEPPEERDSDEQRKQLPRGTETVLLVEDEPNVRELTRQILEMHGYNVVSAGSGDEAVQLCEHYGGTIDLLLTDVVMPGQYHGRQLAEHLQQQYNAMRVIYMSGYANNVITADEALTKAVNFLQKPFSSNQLVWLVRDVLDKTGS